MCEDWDNLIILDACRYETFKKMGINDGKTMRVVSPASSSGPFIEQSYCGRDLHDTIYVTGNGHAHKISNTTFFNLIKTYKKDKLSQLYESRTPEKVAHIAKDTHKQFPNKRLIIHFMQPHIPYIGRKAEQLYKKLKKRDIKLKSQEFLRDNGSSEENYDAIDFTGAAKQGYISDNELRRLYKENLSIVLSSVNKLVDALNGKSIITADHGELLGERPWLSIKKRYGHPHIVTPKLRLIPWHIINAEQRRNIVSEPPIGVDFVKPEVTRHQLEALGYIK
jgi:hypothetical protein